MQQPTPRFASPTSSSRSREAATHSRLASHKPPHASNRVPFSQVNNRAFCKPSGDHRTKSSLDKQQIREVAHPDREGSNGTPDRTAPLYAEALVASLTQFSPMASPLSLKEQNRQLPDVGSEVASPASSEGNLPPQFEPMGTPGWLSVFTDRRCSLIEQRRTSLIDTPLSPQTPVWLRDAAQYLDELPSDSTSAFESVPEPIVSPCYFDRSSFIETSNFSPIPEGSTDVVAEVVDDHELCEESDDEFFVCESQSAISSREEPEIVSSSDDPLLQDAAILCPGDAPTTSSAVSRVAGTARAVGILMLLIATLLAVTYCKALDQSKTTNFELSMTSYSMALVESSPHGPQVEEVITFFVDYSPSTSEIAYGRQLGAQLRIDSFYSLFDCRPSAEYIDATAFSLLITRTLLEHAQAPDTQLLLPAPQTATGQRIAPETIPVEHPSSRGDRRAILSQHDASAASGDFMQTQAISAPVIASPVPMDDGEKVERDSEAQLSYMEHVFKAPAFLTLLIVLTCLEVLRRARHRSLCKSIKAQLPQSGSRNSIREAQLLSPERSESNKYGTEKIYRILESPNGLLVMSPVRRSLRGTKK